MLTILDIQTALMPYDPGPLDGIWGRRTRDALLRFQATKGLPQSGQPDAITLAKMFPDNPAPVAERKAVLPWYGEAQRLKGLREIAGPQHEPTIMEWAKRLKLWFVSDETPWCGLFAAHCISYALPGEPLPANPLAAREWLKFGRKISTASVGTVAVFWRGSPDGWLGHVGFIAGISPRGDRLLILGGNQNNQVREDWLDTERLLGLRWPTTAPLPSPADRVPVYAVGSPLSVNEA